ncbi:site-specific DNA-methyltransferase [Tamlana haliotis]|uniref:site-specific DNA-methyltransferase (adenine-specific) n=1 Tax=Pseudotamlana haliotis TaxID=2614804 RepID=A0A6N6MIG1_9FLAO|nr:site-specific DNA-methyltransferase [Tamlana haliotis]KAB1069293.1 site-specific DNA-methyltransferase [Tamlana haliotis]
MPTLNWIGKDKVISHHQNVPYRVLEHKYGFTAKEGEQTEPTHSGNKIIHGDNLEALKSLLPEYEGKIKCIYIDPPYNTGNESWVYNDNVNHPKIKKWLGEVVGKDGEDLTRHDKWLCMMYPRLQLLHKLLAVDGVIFISIDDNEQANLKLLCDEIFGKNNFIAESIVQSNSAKNNAKYISVTHEYMFIYAKNISQVKSNWNVKKSNVDEFVKRTNQLIKSSLTQDEIKKELRQLTKYPRFFDFDHYLYVDKKGPFRASDLTAPNSTKFFDIIHPDTKRPCKTGTRGWGRNEEQILELIKEDKILFGKDESVMPQLKNHLVDNINQTPKSVLFFDTQTTTKWIKANNFKFNFPKPIELIEYVLEIDNNKDSIILDSFAGSGTTAHAVLNLNKQDGGNRKFILVEMEDYANSVTSERVKLVTKGYGKGNKRVEGTDGAFDFYELGLPLFDENHNLNEQVDIEKIREYIWFSETRTQFKETKDKNYFLGKKDGSAYYFIYEKNNLTTLDFDALELVKTKGEQYVIYADNCLLPKEFMAKNNIIFKKIPRDITRF